MRAAVHIALLELRRRLRDRSLLAQGIGGPILLAGIIGLAFGGASGASFTVEVGLADDDGSAISTQLVDGLREVADTEDGPPVVLVDLSDGDAARDAVDDDSVDAALVIPDGFGEAVSGAGPTPPLVVYATGSRRISGDLTVAVAEQLAARVDAIRLTYATAAALGLDPPTEAAVPTGSMSEEPVGGDFNAVAFFAPSMGILFLFFTVGAGARSLLRERSDGTLARVRAAPISSTAILTGKALAVLGAGILSMAVVWAVTAVAFGADWGEPVGVALVLTATVVAVAGIASLLTAVARTEAQADATTGAVAFVFALIGGNFIGPGSLPPVLQVLSLATPNGWALQTLTELSAGDATAGDALPAVAVLVAIGLVTGMIGTVGLSRRLS